MKGRDSYFLFIISPLFLQIQSDLQYIKEDIHAVERRRIELYRQRDRYPAKLRMLGDEPSPISAWQSMVDKHNGAAASRSAQAASQYRLTSGDLPIKKADARSSAMLLRKDSHGGSDTQNPSQSGQAMARKRRVHAQVSC